MKTPTQIELMEYLDGTLSPGRSREIAEAIERTPPLKREVQFLAAMRTAAGRLPGDAVPSGFTEKVMGEILPVPETVHRYRFAQFSSSFFAMALVLSIVVIVLFSGTAADGHSSGAFGTVLQSYGTVYEKAVSQWSEWVRRSITQAGGAERTNTSRFILLGLAVMAAFAIADEVLGKRFFRRQLHH